MARTRFLPITLFDTQLLASRRLATSSVGHLSVDLFSGMMPLVLLLQRDALGLSYSQVGFVSMTFSLASSLTQPFFGWLGDRWGHARLMAFSAAVMGPTVGGMLIADRFTLLLLLSLVAGLASGLFHPQGASLSAQTAVERRGSSVSIFMLGGNLGYSFGPLVASFVLAVGGQLMPALLGLLGVSLAVFVYWLVRGLDQGATGARGGTQGSERAAALALVVTVTLVVFLRSWVQSSVSTYIPQLFRANGASTAEAGNVLFGILFPLALGGLVGGTLSDHLGRRRVLIASTAVIGPAMYGLLHSSGPSSYFFGPLLGASIGASIPVSIIMTQELVPRGLGLMSGIAMGLSFVSGAIGVWATGLLADQIGLYSALSINAALPIAAALLAFFLPPDQLKRPAGSPVARAETLGE
ncbi:MAG: MFS transporter [Rudaea sp.]